MKASQILAKSPLESFYHVFSSLSLKLIWKMSPLVLGGMVAVSGNTLTADGKYFVQNYKNFTGPIEKQWSEKRNSFSEFFVQFLESTLHFKHFESKDDRHSSCISEHTVKNFVRSFCKERRFRTRFDSQHVKSCKIIAKSSWERFYQVFFWWSGKLIWKMCPLVLREILEVFVNTLTGDDRYPVQDCENLTLPIQMELSEK